MHQVVISNTPWFDTTYKVLLIFTPKYIIKIGTLNHREKPMCILHITVTNCNYYLKIRLYFMG